MYIIHELLHIYSYYLETLILGVIHMNLYIYIYPINKQQKMYKYQKELIEMKLSI